MEGRRKLIVVTSHPIQYQAPLWRALHQQPDIDVVVLYASDRGARRYYDEQFGRSLQWDVPLLDGYRSRVLPSASLPRLHWRLEHSCPSISRELEIEQPDAVLLVGKEYWYYVQALRAARRRRIPILYRAETPPPRRGVLSHTVGRIQRRWAYGQMSAFLCIGQAQASFYASYGVPSQQIFWAPYCVDNTYFEHQRARWLPERKRIREQYGFAERSKVIVNVAKFIPKKRPMDLIRAIERLPRHEYGLLMVGSGPLLASCREYVRKRRLHNVVFAGFQNQGAIGSMYVAGDCFALPSQHGETWGLATNEAMNFGLPLVLSEQVGCSYDLIEPGQNGFRYPTGDVEALSARLREVFADEERRRRMGQRSAAIVRGYAPEIVVRGIRAALVRVTSSARAA